MNTQLFSNPRLISLKVVIYTITVLLTFFSFFNFYHHRFLLATSELIMLMASIILIIKLKKILVSKYTNILTTCYTSAIVLAWIFTVVIQPMDEMVFFWYFPILVACYAINGAKTGFRLTSALSIITIIVCYGKLHTNSFTFSLVTWLNTLLPPVSVWIVVHIYEYNNNRITKKLSNLATHDTLTGLKNRHQVYNTYKNYTNKINSLILIDIDGLYKVNEKHGYLMGDLVLISVADILKKDKDSSAHQLFRIDGDEFAILLSDADFEYASSLATTLSNEISKHKIISQHDIIQVTVSIGVASINSDGYNFDELLQKANSILQDTKTCVCTLKTPNKH